MCPSLEGLSILTRQNSCTKVNSLPKPEVLEFESQSKRRKELTGLREALPPGSTDKQTQPACPHTGTLLQLTDKPSAAASRASGGRVQLGRSWSQQVPYVGFYL